MVKNNSIVADRVDSHGECEEEQTYEMTDDVVGVVVDGGKEVVVQHAPQAPPHVHRGKEPKENGENVERLQDVEFS